MANKALLVGINKYKIQGADLQGCVNDVTNMRDIILKDRKVRRWEDGKLGG